MRLYTSKVVAQWLCLTERRVRQLRDEGVIVEARPGLYELQPTVARYISYIGGAGKESLTNERMKLTAAKRRTYIQRFSLLFEIFDFGNSRGSYNIFCRNFIPT